jgi:hypothetical protein
MQVARRSRSRGGGIDHLQLVKGLGGRHHATEDAGRSGTPASVTAEAIFNHAAKAIDIENIDARVAEWERAAESSKGRR